MIDVHIDGSLLYTPRCRSAITTMSTPASTTVLLVLLPVLLFSYAASGLIQLIFRQQLSPLRRLRGPPSPSFFMGNLLAMHDQENNNLIARWQAAYGSSFVYHGFIGGCRLMTTDPRAIAHILGNAYDYPKPDFVRDSLATMAAGHDGELSALLSLIHTFGQWSHRGGCPAERIMSTCFVGYTSLPRALIKVSR